MREPWIIGHRGVPGERLEHTAPSYLLAIEYGADFIEPDVVATRDGVLVVRHENEIGTTTDIADRPEFADRRTTKTVDGVELTGWFTEDLTLEEIKTLRTRERIADLRPGNAALDGSEPVMTFDEVLELSAAHGGHPVYVETKHPSHFLEHGLDLNALVLEALDRHGRNTTSSSDVIQSFETGNLQAIREHTPLPLVLLMEKDDAPVAPHQLAEIAEYADGIGPHKQLVLQRDVDQRTIGATSLVADAHEVGLLVHPWTMRDENAFLPRELRAGGGRAAHGDAIAECLAYFDAGVDGLFSDFTRTAVLARERWWSARPSA